MKIYNEDKTQILDEKDIDLTNGYLVDDTLEIKHEEVKAVVEQSHYETIKEYDNGGKDVIKVIDVEGVEYKPEYTETINIKVYKPITQEMRNAQRISELKSKLSQTDYKAIKYAEGQLTEEEYAPIKAQRQAWRDEINQLESEV